MDDLSWERNVTFLPWNNISDHRIEEELGLGSETVFLNPNPVQHLEKTNSINAPSSFGSASQYWFQSLTVNGFHEGKNVIPIPSGTTATTCSNDQDDVVSVVFPHQKSKNGVANSNNFASDSSQCSWFSDDNPPNRKRPRSESDRSDSGRPVSSSTINFQQTTSSDQEPDSEAIAQMKEMIFRAAAFRPVTFMEEEEAMEKPRRKNVKISKDPQTVAARQRREKISERIRALQKLVPGGNKMDTASMLDEAANYLKFLRSQVKALEQLGTTSNALGTSYDVTVGVPLMGHSNPFAMQTHFLLPYQEMIYPSLPSV